MNIRANGIGALLLLLLPAAAWGQELRGSVGLETRAFPSEPVYGAQSAATLQPSALLEPELLWDFREGDLQLTLQPYLRLDGQDGARTHADLRQASALYLADGWTLFAGVGKVFWGKTEAHHLVDIVNQTDGVEDVDGEDKLGQPMIDLTIERSWGALDLLYMPYFRERTYPGARARLRGPLPVVGDAVYTSGAGRWHPDFAARWSHYLGSFDVAASAFYGTSREPRLSVELRGDRPVLVPRYDVIDQFAVEAQWTRGATLWKLEGMTRGGHGDRFLAAVVGVEHTLFGLGGGSSDLGILGELMVDGRGDDAPPTVFDNDVFLGLRWALNDSDDTSVLGGAIVDYRTGETIAFLEAERRIGGRWTVEIESRWFQNTLAGGVLSGLRRDDFFTLRVRRHF